MTAASRKRIGFWAAPDKKQQFIALAASKDMTESELLAMLVDHVLGNNPTTDPAQAPNDDDEPGDAGGMATERVTLRLRPGDRRHIETRAAQRDMKPGSYLVALVHAHVRQQPPFPMAELNQLKVAVGELSAVGRNLNQLARAANEGKGALSNTDAAVTLADVHRQVEQLRQAVADLVRANIMSWESGRG